MPRFVHLLALVCFVLGGCKAVAACQANDSHQAVDAEWAERIAAIEAALDEVGKAKLAEMQSLGPQVEGAFAAGQLQQAMDLMIRITNLRGEIYGKENPVYAESLHDMGFIFEAAGDYQNAESYHQNATEMRKKTLGPQHPLYAQSLTNLGSNARARMQYTVAKRLFETAHKIISESLAKDSPEFANSLNDLGSIAHAMGDYPKAVEYLQTANALCEQLNTRNHADFATSLNNLASTYLEMGEFRKAEESFEEAISILQRVAGKQHPYYTNYLKNLANTFQRQGKFEQAAALLDEARQLIEGFRGKDSFEYAEHLLAAAELNREQGNFQTSGEQCEQAASTIKNLSSELHPLYGIATNKRAMVFQAVGDFVEAEARYRKAQAIFRQSVGEGHFLYATSLNNLAVIAMKLGRYPEVEKLYIDAIEILKKTAGPDSQLLAGGFHNLGTYYWHRGNFAQAEIFCRRGAEMRERLLGTQHPDFADSLGSLGAIYDSMGDDVQAQRFFERAHAVRKSVLNETHPEYVNSLTTLAAFNQQQGENAKCRSMLEDALRIIESTSGKQTRDYAMTLNNLATTYQNEGDFSKADQFYQRSLQVFAEIGEVQHPKFAHCLTNAATVDVEQDQLAAALQKLMQANEIYSQMKPIIHPDYLNNLDNLIIVYRRTGDFARADETARELIRLSGEAIDTSAVVQAERQQLAMAAKYGHFLGAYIDLQTEYPDAVRDGYDAFLQHKGRVQFRQRMLRILADRPELRTLADNLRLTAAKMANIAGTRPNSKAEWSAWKSRYQAAIEAHEAAEKSLVEASSEFGRLTGRTTTLQDLQNVLPANAVLLDFCALVPGKYVVYVVQPSGSATLVDLGSSDAIDLAVHDLRFDIVEGRDCEQAGRKLRSLIWDPIASFTSNTDLVLVSPDGILGTVPLAAIAGHEPASYLIEDVRLAIVPVPLLLARPASPTDQPNQRRGLLAVGDVAFGRPSGPMTTAPTDEQPQSQLDKTLPLPQTVDSFAVRGTTMSTDGSPAFAPLPATAVEVEAIERMFVENHQGSEANVYVLRGEQATTENVIQSAIGARYLHIATHGFFSDPAENSAVNSQSRETPITSRPNAFDDTTQVTGYHPGALSGIVLAGANEPLNPLRDDGILTATEIISAPLQGMEMVVLSACETGMGPVAGGEGLLGVQRAFQVSGAASTVASLWRVDDNATQILMENFYRNLWQEKMAKVDALREAQLRMLNRMAKVELGPDRGKIVTLSDAEIQQVARPKPSGKRMHPRYWAGFSVSGLWE
jgi:CHAT domain-containing protein/Tfp pilus assembly protein PilF